MIGRYSGLRGSESTDEYISRESIIEELEEEIAMGDEFNEKDVLINKGLKIALKDIKRQPSADVQEKRYCRMIPLEPDCRGYTDVFICTNCHHHIYLGFIRKEYSGSFCLECGAEVKDGDAE